MAAQLHQPRWDRKQNNPPTVLEVADEWSVDINVTLGVLQAIGVPETEAHVADFQALGCIDEPSFKEAMAELEVSGKKANLYQRG